MRARILEGAAAEIRARGVAATTLDVRQLSAPEYRSEHLLSRALSLAVRHVENDAESGLARHHALVGFRGVLEWQHFDHGRNCVLGAEG